ncbi:alpha-galactosidase [Myceligenerans pegani]|uniref:alpha-galactosidase n=1 Tax=Myceligenerans pegani TaxID=2776917 RepID=A0ABR9MTS9_9MICO|nr:alpha-galactosidase [Myceligenerans sp. TRM 65318]MBE1874773.1 alpha-galactosidase [Myceligenerans sp. TRM 65318]MBE3017044.1 alpha-galactosidase [Myceligenerans sp. TRM 65318]
MTHTPPASPQSPTVLRRDGVAVVLEHPATGLPSVLHWGADLGPLPAADLAALDAATDPRTPPAPLDAGPRVPLLPQESDGWSGRPGMVALRDGRPVFPRWTVTGRTGDDATLRLTASSDGLELSSVIAVGHGGLVTLRHALTNTGEGTVTIDHLDTALPVPRGADHLTSFTGRWAREKTPVTTSMPPGASTVTSRRGRGGHDAPWVSIASAGEPRNRTGESWAVHLGWSADVVHRTDRMTDHETQLGAGELLRPGEIRLAPGETYEAPVAYFAWSDNGLDGLSRRFHTWLRAREQHPATARPLVLNTWEAVYFDHDPERVAELARAAAAVGVERFVLDDGWFHDRRDDTRGLGDWVVDPAVWPEGLQPLADLVHGLGMQFGLWFEPEMVNLDSDLAREHPEWILGNPASVPSPDGLSFRNQYVLDLAHPGAWEHVRGQMSALIDALGVDFVKWDHNRDLVEAVHVEGTPAGGTPRPGTHAQTLAAYRLVDRLKADHPGLEIESCSSGGARTDLGILARTDRVWASDSNDPAERQDIQRWTELVLPPELIGAHVGPSPAHSSGRATDLSYRVATALQGHAGFEWNLLECTPEETEAVTAYAALYKELRGLLHSGTVVHGDTADPALRVRGVVAPDGAEAVFTVATVGSLADARPERVTLPGLDPGRRYTVRVRDEAGRARWFGGTPRWLGKDADAVPGVVLDRVGLQIPNLWPMQALILHLRAV